VSPEPDGTESTDGGGDAAAAEDGRGPRHEDSTGHPVPRYYYARVTPGSIQAGVTKHDPEEPRAKSGGQSDEGSRSAIGGFSAASRNRMLRRAVSLPWEMAVLAGGVGMHTFTYPASFPTDGELVKRQWDRLYSKWVRHYGVPMGMWKLEFQHRGAPHFHFFGGMPEPEDELRAWLLRAWYEAVGSGDERHLYNGVDISRWRWGTLGENRSKVGEYFARHGAKGWKSYQNELPEGYSSPGRWWGYWGRSAGFTPVEHVRVFDSRSEYFAFRRLTWTLQEKNRGRKPRRGGRDRGAFTLSVDGLTTGVRWAKGA
jgi:hypothetical protein